MLGIGTFLRGVYAMMTKLTKKTYRSCALVVAGTVTIAIVSFNSAGFNAAGKNKTAASRNALASAEQQNDSSDEEETDTQAKIQAGIGNVLNALEDSQEFIRAEHLTERVMAPIEPDEEETEEDTNETMPIIELSDKDEHALLRIVEAEATGEDITGKILVGNVILNRVNHPDFPDTVVEVVFQREGGHVQFSPTADGRYESVVITAETKEAINAILAGEDYSQGALFFSARDKADPSNMRWFDNNLKWLFEYGGHEFYTLK